MRESSVWSVARTAAPYRSGLVRRLRRGRRAGQRHNGGSREERRRSCRLRADKLPAGDTGSTTPGPSLGIRWRREKRNQPSASAVPCVRRHRSTAGWAAGSRSALIVPTKPGNPCPGDPVEGRGASSRFTVGGKHDRDTELGLRVHETTADRGVGETSSADGVYFVEPLPRSLVAVRGLPAYAHATGLRASTDKPRSITSETWSRISGLCSRRAKSGTYRAPPVRRVHIPKGTGSETRPIGIPTFEDKVQRACRDDGVGSDLRAGLS